MRARTFVPAALLFRFLLSMLMVMPCVAQAPAQPKPQTAPAQQEQKPTNLQFFPKDTTREQLIQTMRGFSFSLGVRCIYCHVGTDNPGGNNKVDFASDEKDTKKSAREMLRMVATLNQQYISKLPTLAKGGDATAVPQVQCVTCHRGLPKPVTMNGLLADTIEKKGVAEAVAQYRELRQKGTVRGAYDFSETPLNVLTESLLQQHKNKEAAAIEELNADANAPIGMWSMNLLAMAHAANNEKDKAKADFQKILEKDPQNSFAKQQLEQLNSESK